MILELQSFFGVVGFGFCLVCYSVGLWVIGTMAWLGVRLLDIRFKTMQQRAEIFRGE